MVGAADSAENAYYDQVEKLIKEWERHRVDAALRESLCETVDLIFPDDKVERINKVKGNFKHKKLVVELAAALILYEKIKGPTVYMQRQYWTLSSSRSTLSQLGRQRRVLLTPTRRTTKNADLNVSNIHRQRK